MSYQDDDTRQSGTLEEKDPIGKIQWLLGLIITVAILTIIGGVISLTGASNAAALSTGWTMVGGGIGGLVSGIFAFMISDCVEYRNHLIREQNELLKKQEARVIKKEFEEYEAAKAEAKAKAKAARAEAEAEEKKAE